jgi:DNA-binding winged helix-turn-helix (wHTH) protein
MRRIYRRRPMAGPAQLDEWDILRRGARWTALAPIEARIVAVLLEREGRVVRRRDLAIAWPNGCPADRAVDGRLTTLRARIAPLGLEIRTVRARGFVLEVLPELDVASTGGPATR